jgi:cell division protein FtsQ
MVLATSGWFLAHSSLFGLDGIQVSGTHLLSRAEILQVTDLHVGQNMLSVHADQLRDVIKRLPLVRSVRVIRTAPSRLRIVIVERTAAFVLQTLEGRWYLDGDGVLLGEVPPEAPALPTITIDKPLGADPGDQVQSRLLESAVGLWRSLPESLRTGASAIDATSPAGLTLLRPNMTVRFGTIERLDEKLEAMRLVFDRARKERARVVMLDVRSPSRPAAQIA